MTSKYLFRAVLTACVMAVLGLTQAAQAGWWHHHGSYGSAGSYVGYGSAGSYAVGYGSYGSAGSAGSYGSYSSAGSWGSRHYVAYPSYSSYGSYGSTGSYAASYSSTGSYGSYGTYRTSYASSGSHGSHGSHGGLLHRIFHHKRYYASCGSTGSYVVSYGSTGSYGSYGSTGGYSSVGSSIYGGSTIITDGVPVESGTVIGPAPAPATPAAPTPAPMSSIDRTSATISVLVPADARVFVNGNLTKSTGTNRQYVSRGLVAGQSYTYELRMEYTVDGKTEVENKTVRLIAGERVDLAFAQGINPTLNVSTPATKIDSSKTTLILKVPADAKVRLAGNLTSQTGEVREYITNRLSAGEAWSNYTITVEATVNGEVKTQEKTITLYAGDERKVDFDFDNNTAINRTAAR
jgi:uncharacterized protein (TIGR03000 family)